MDTTRGLNKGHSLWPSTTYIGAALAAGVIAVLMQSSIAQLILLHVLQPNSSGVILIPENPFFQIIFPLKLFVASALFIAICALTAWNTARDPSRISLEFTALLCASFFVTLASVNIYRLRMQVAEEFSLNGQTLSRTKGQMTRLSDVPIIQLGLVGPIIVCAGTIGVRRKRAGMPHRAK